MSNIDYKAEVLKHYPDAYYVRFDICFYEIMSCEPPCISLSIGGSEQEAWQNAYEQLKKEGKIK